MADEVVGIVGAGIVGLAIGREITRRRPGTRVVVLEKEERVAAHQTGHNSGVVHAGIYYKPGSLKARLCTRGGAMLREYCAERSLPYEECGKLVVAVTPDDVARLDALSARGGLNAVAGLRPVTAAEIREIEPHATGLAALYSPRTAITDYTRIAESFAADIVAAGGEVRLGFGVDRVTPVGDALVVASGERTLAVDRLIVCAGIHADVVAGLAGLAAEPRIVPFRGEYMRIVPAKTHMVRGLIIPGARPAVPVPRRALHQAGRRHGRGRAERGTWPPPGRVTAGATSRCVICTASCAWPGTWRMAAKHWRTGVREMYGSVSKRAYMTAARRVRARDRRR